MPSVLVLLGAIWDLNYSSLKNEKEERSWSVAGLALGIDNSMIGTFVGKAFLF